MFPRDRRAILANRELVQKERAFYDRRWESSSLTDFERDRIAQTLGVLPTDCRRILDAGCGDGRVSQEISAVSHSFVVAFDLSMVALRSISLPKCCGSAAELPFRDRSFDLVMATEILEHLPEALYSQVLGEMSRVAGRYILITVPNSENLQEHKAACAVCGSKFHVWGHLRSYTSKVLEGLFDGFRLVRTFTFGEPVDIYNRPLLFFRQKVAGAYYWEDGTVCHSCGASSTPKVPWPFLVRVCDALNARLWARFFKRQGWVLGLWERDKV